MKIPTNESSASGLRDVVPSLYSAVPYLAAAGKYPGPVNAAVLAFQAGQFARNPSKVMDSYDSTMQDRGFNRPFSDAGSRIGNALSNQVAAIASPIRAGWDWLKSKGDAEAATRNAFAPGGKAIPPPTNFPQYLSTPGKAIPQMEQDLHQRSQGVKSGWVKSSNMSRILNAITLRLCGFK